MLCIQVSVYSQKNFSPRLKKEINQINAEDVFSISVKDSIQFFKQYGNTVILQRKYGTANILSIRASNGALLHQMALDSNIIFIDWHRKPIEEAGTDFMNLAFNRITKAHHYFSEILNVTPRISIKEQKFDETNIDLINRSFNTTATPELTSQHATAMAIHIAGGGNSSANGLGVAPAARITSSDFENLLPDGDNIFQKNDIHLQKHSYCVGIENY
jgi:hypothetical protein